MKWNLVHWWIIWRSMNLVCINIHLNDIQRPQDVFIDFNRLLCSSIYHVTTSQSIHTRGIYICFRRFNMNTKYHRTFPYFGSSRKHVLLAACTLHRHLFQRTYECYLFTGQTSSLTWISDRLTLFMHVLFSLCEILQQGIILRKGRRSSVMLDFSSFMYILNT